jgi:hypothetical protein
MVAWHGCWVMIGRGEREAADGVHDAPVYCGRGALGAANWGATGAGCVCGIGQTTSNRGGQRGLHLRGESCGRVGTATKCTCGTKIKSAPRDKLCGCLNASWCRTSRR